MRIGKSLSKQTFVITHKSLKNDRLRPFFALLCCQKMELYKGVVKKDIGV